MSDPFFSYGSQYNLCSYYKIQYNDNVWKHFKITLCAGYSDFVSETSVVDIFHGDTIYRIIYILHDNNRKYYSKCYDTIRFKKT